MDARDEQKKKYSRANLSEIRIQALLKEYELSKTNADKLEETIWNTAAVLVSGSIAGMALLGGAVPGNPGLYDYFLRGTIGLLSMFLVFWWRKMVSVWYFIQKMMYIRGVEIEEELDLYMESYIEYLERASRGEDYPDRPGVKKMMMKMKDEHKPISVARGAYKVAWTLIVVWFLFLTAQFAAMPGWI